MADGKHTILLIQPQPNKQTRTFMDFETVSQSMDGLCQMFETQLKRLNPQFREVTYDISDLYNWIDALADLSALVFEPQLSAYLPYNKDWIKKRAYTHLRRQAQ